MNIKANIIVDAIRWGLEQQGIQVYIEHKGDNDAGAIYINHDKGEGLYDVYHRVNDYEKGRKIKFLKTYTEEKLGKFLKNQIDIDNDLWLIEVVSSKIDLEAFFREQGL